MKMCLDCMIDDGFPFRECVENVINYFSLAGVVRILNGVLPNFRQNLKS